MAGFTLKLTDKDIEMYVYDYKSEDYEETMKSLMTEASSMYKQVFQNKPFTTDELIESIQNDVVIKVPDNRFLSISKTPIYLQFGSTPSSEASNLMLKYGKAGCEVSNDKPLEWRVGVSELFDFVEVGRTLARDLQNMGYNVSLYQGGLFDEPKKLQF